MSLTLAAYRMETEVDFEAAGSWTLAETVVWAKKQFGDDVSTSFEGLRTYYVHAHVMYMYIHIHDILSHVHRLVSW